MKMNVRKWLSAVLAVAMMAVMLPLGAMPVAAETDPNTVNHITNHNFNSGVADGWTLSDNSSIVTDPTNSNMGYVMQTNESTTGSMLKQTVALAPNTDYVFAFQFYSYNSSISNAAFFVGMGNITDFTAVSDLEAYAYNSTSVRVNIKSSYNAWHSVAISFNSGDRTNITLNISNYRGGKYYFNNFYLVTSNAQFDNRLMNSDFETGDGTAWTLQNTAEVVADPTGAGQGYVVKTTSAAGGTMISQMASLNANTDYVLSFKVYNYSTQTNAAFWLDMNPVINWTTADVVTDLTVQDAKINDHTMRINIGTKTNAWYTVTVPFNSGDATNTTISMYNYRSSNDAGSYYFDDIVLMEAEGSGSTSTSVGYVDYDACYTATGSYADLLEKEYVVEEGKTYTLSFSYLAITNAFHCYVNDVQDDQLGYAYCSSRNNANSSITFRAISDKAVFRMKVPGNGLETSVIVNDLTLVEIPDTPVDIIQFKGMSAREQAPEPDNITAGLGFLFRVNMKNAVTVKESDGHIYQTNTATAYPFTNSLYADDPYPYTVVRVGAVMSLDPDAANAGLTLESTAEDRTTIDVVGRKRWTYNDTDMANSYSYAVRIVNIPELHFSTTIYARPYVIVQAGERTVTLYGQMQQGTYESFFGTEA